MLYIKCIMELYIFIYIRCSFWNTTDPCIDTVLYEWYVLLCILWSNFIWSQILQFFGSSPFSHLKVNITKFRKYCSLCYIYFWLMYSYNCKYVCMWNLKGVFTSLKTIEGFYLFISYPICQIQEGKHSLTCKFILILTYM